MTEVALINEAFKVPESVKEEVLKLLLHSLEEAVRRAEGRRFSVLEIGTAHGFSSVKMAQLAPEIFVTTMEYNESRAAEASKNIASAGLSGRIRVLCGDAARYLPDIPDNSYDFAFLDGPKAQYRKHFDHLMRIVKPRCTICIDNVNFNRDEKKYRTIRKRMADFRDYLTSIGGEICMDSGFARYEVGNGRNRTEE